MLAGKDVENRGWATPYRGPLAIHASKGNHSDRDVARILDDLVEDEMITAELRAKIAGRIAADRGSIIGVVDLVGAAQSSASRWWVPGQIALRLANPRVLEQPIPERGQQGLKPYEPTGELASILRRAS